MSDTNAMGVETFEPNRFDADRHFYARTLNAQIHPLVSNFFGMSLPRLINRYGHLHPKVSEEALLEVLTTKPRYLRWSGSDLFNVTSETGVRKKLILETNSCPSGQKSFPNLSDSEEEGGYRRLLENTFVPLVAKHVKQAPENAVVCVLYDKNPMESSGYAQVMATLLNRPVYWVPCLKSAPEKFLEIRDRELFLKLDGATVPIACAFRYVTQKPWTRLPFNLKTPILNPIVACLAGGRNKTSAAKAFELFNSEFRERGLEILTPESFTNIRKAEVPLIVSRLGGRAVVKVPYLNAGQGIYTIVNEDELEKFMETEFEYDEFIVQQLVGNLRWSSTGKRGRYYNVGTVPNKDNEIYVFDMRMMISWQIDHYAPVAMYARRAPEPMSRDLEEGRQSWAVLGTNLSRKVGEDHWDTEPKRLLMMDRKDFNKLGMGLDDLIECFVQSVMANRAIDDMAKRLVKRGGGLRSDLLMSLCNDPELVNEIRVD